MRDFFFARQNDDGTYGEPIKAEIVDLDFTTQGVGDPTPIPSFTEDEEVSFEFDLTMEWVLFLSYCQDIAKRTCRACKNCKQMYHYPGFVDAEEYECTAGLECDTWFDEVKDCPKYEVLPYGEPHPRNPNLDKYIYVLKGE